MPQAVIDHVDTLDMEEVNGAITSVTRLARVIGLVNTDYTILWTALEAAGVPPYHSTLPEVTVPGVNPFSGLVLTRRSARLHNDDRGTVDATLKYEHLLAGPNQQLQQPRSGVIYTKGKCSIREKATNFFYPFGVHSGIVNGTAVEQQRLTVAHQYGNSTSENGELAGLFKEQVGEIKVPFPESNIQFQGVVTILNPVAYAYKFIAAINRFAWQSQPELTWLISEVSWEILRPDTNLYKFGFEMQNNPDGWDPDIVYIDSRTNLPPSDVLRATTPDQYGIVRLVDNPLTLAPNIPAGAWKVPYLRRLNFEVEFGAFFEGTP